MNRTVRTTTRAAACRVTAAGALVVLTGLLASCGEDSADEVDGTETPSESAESPESEEPEESAPEDDSIDSSELAADAEPTAPDTVLDVDEPAVVRLPYASGGRGLYAVDLVSVEEQPVSKLPPDVPVAPGSTLWYVVQDWTMIDRGNGSVTGMNLSSHTSVSIGDDQQVTSVLFTDIPGCEVQQFIPEDGDSGKTRRSCTAYLVPRGESIEQVWYFEFESKFDYSTGGAPVRWRVEA